MTTTEAPPIETAPPAAGRKRARRLTLKNVLMVIAGLVILVLLLCALIPGVLAPYNPLTQNLRETLLSPNSHGPSGDYHLLGTDPLGRDVLSRLIYGARISLGVGLSGVVISAAIGIPLGLLAGYRGGWLDSVLMRLVDGILSFPSLVLYIFLSYVFGGGVFTLIIILAALRWVTYVRVTRSITLTQRDMAYVESAKMVGCGDARILFRHILPNIAAPLLVLAALEVANLILVESSLSYLGLGVQPPTASWGLMISDGSNYMASSPWLIAAPGVAIFLATLSLNIVGRQGRERVLRESKAA
jgi:peptide/nickel transport system permease protein